MNEYDPLGEEGNRRETETQATVPAKKKKKFDVSINIALEANNRVNEFDQIRELLDIMLEKAIRGGIISSISYTIPGSQPNIVR